ncbi:MAG: monooxygenase flavin-binding family protein, partial [Hyphomonadaceae bacterium]
RSPSYVFNRPKRDWFANLMKRILPPKLAYEAARLKFTFMSRLMNNHVLKHPEEARKRLMDLMKRDLPEGFDMRHFTPNYNVWDQRVCAAPDGDFFDAVKGGNVEVVTGNIKQISEDAIELESGEKIDTDIIIKATGLNLIAGPKFAMSIDGQNVDISKCIIYKGAMFSNVPNFAFVFGYLMASWTLKADLVARYFIRFIDEIEAKGAKSGTPKLDVNSITPVPMFNFSSGYITRSIDKLPKQTANFPWTINQDYKVDKNIFLKMPIDDGVIEYGGRK